jgi:hypothetical protein
MQTETFPALKVPRQWPLFSTVMIIWREGKALGSEEDKEVAEKSIMVEARISSK